MARRRPASEKPGLKLTRAGTLYIIMTLALGFGAVNTGNNLLYLLVSALLGFMTVSGLLGRSNIKNLRLKIDPIEEIYDGVETLLRVRQENNRRFLPAFLVEVQVPQGSTRFNILDPGQETTSTITVCFKGRGRKRIETARILSAFPINFFIRNIPIPLDASFTVYPAPRFCREPGGASQDRKKGHLEGLSKGMEGDITRIADYSGAEPLKFIHWKLSARQDQLKVKELSDISSPPVVITLSDLPGKSVEERLRCASYLINHYLRNNRPVGLKLQRKAIAPATGKAHKQKLLTELALYGQD